MIDILILILTFPSSKIFEIINILSCLDCTTQECMKLHISTRLCILSYLRSNVRPNQKKMKLNLILIYKLHPAFIFSNLDYCVA